MKTTAALAYLLLRCVAAFAPPSPALRSPHVVPAATEGDGVEEVACAPAFSILRFLVRIRSRHSYRYPFTESDPELEQNLIDMTREGIERHPVLVRSVAERTAEMLEDDRPMNKEDDSIPARMERFFVGLVRHPAMLWSTFIRVSELMEEELTEKGDEKSAAQADKIRQVRIAAEAVRESRQIDV